MSLDFLQTFITVVCLYFYHINATQQLLTIRNVELYAALFIGC